MVKRDLTAELADVAPVTPAEPEASSPPTSNGKNKRQRGRSSKQNDGPRAGPRAKRRNSQSEDQPEAERLAAETLAAAEVERLTAEARGAAEALAAAVPPTETGPQLSKAQRQQIRRAGRRQVAVELEADQGRMLDALVAEHGSQRAAIGLAIERLYVETTDGE